MSEETVVRSFAALAEVPAIAELLADAGEEPARASPPLEQPATGAAGPTEQADQADRAGPHDLADLLAELESASATLATVARQDEEARASAHRELDAYDALLAAQREAEGAHERAREVRGRAEALAAGAFADEARAAAARAADTAARAEEAAAALVEARRRAAACFAAAHDLERLLAERRRAEEAEHERAAAAERAGRLSHLLAGAKSALAAGRLEEAQELLGTAGNVNPGNPEIASLQEILERRTRDVKVDAAEEALWTARRQVRRAPAEAVAALAALDVPALPETLAGQVCGCWADACARLCRERALVEPLWYAAGPGRRAVVAREESGGAYRVVSALGMGETWRAGAAVGLQQLRRARPLR